MFPTDAVFPREDAVCPEKALYEDLGCPYALNIRCNLLMKNSSSSDVMISFTDESESTFHIEGDAETPASASNIMQGDSHFVGSAPSTAAPSQRLAARCDDSEISVGGDWEPSAEESTSSSDDEDDNGDIEFQRRYCINCTARLHPLQQDRCRSCSHCMANDEAVSSTS